VEVVNRLNGHLSMTTICSAQQPERTKHRSPQVSFLRLSAKWKSWKCGPVQASEITSTLNPGAVLQTIAMLPQAVILRARGGGPSSTAGSTTSAVTGARTVECRTPRTSLRSTTFLRCFMLSGEGSARPASMGRIDSPRRQETRASSKHFENFLGMRGLCDTAD